MADGDALSPAQYGRALRAWLREHEAELAPHRRDPDDCDARAANLRALQARLWDAGWARWGWPERAGGKGGDALHRAVFYEALADAGYPPRFLLEHLEIVAPTLVRFGTDELVSELLPTTLRADTIWCQGFSEPGAGSDLPALRTRAERIPGGFRIRGHKIWTTWAVWADRCLVLARTGAAEARHRALSMFALDLKVPGVTVGVIRQANGTPELAEVFFDGVEIEDSRLVGGLDRGWEVAMYLLSCERGAFGWQRHVFLYPRLAQLAQIETGEPLGSCAVDAFAVRARSWSTLRELASGSVPGPEAAVNKVLTTDFEQRFYDMAARALGPQLALGNVVDAPRWQEDYLFSRAVGIYGGTRQIQLNTIASHLLRPRTAPPQDEYGEFLDAARVALASQRDGRTALEELGWWEAAGPGASGEALLALGALFEAQGRELAVTPALGGLLAAEILDAAGCPAGLRGSCALRVERLHSGGLRLWLPACADAAERIAFELPGGGAAWVSAEHCALERTGALDPDQVWVATLDAGAAIPISAAERLEGAAERVRALARICASFEILGACEAMLESAITHAAEREQFGKPIVEHQAVQHLLAEAHVARASLRAASRLALERLCAGALDAELALLLAALAGRSGRAIGERALQVFGAIGFTQEHPLHRYQRRTLTLEALIGSARALELELDSRACESGHVPRGPDAEELPGA